MNYLKNHLNKKNIKKENLIEANTNIENEGLKRKEEKLDEINAELCLYGDISYNQSFIPQYDIYANFSLISNI